MKVTFHTREDYFKFVRTALLFTHLRAYNGQCNIWKDEDLEFIKKLDDKEFYRNNPKEVKKCLAIWSKARTEYGDDFDDWRDYFSDHSPAKMLYEFGLILNENDEEDNYVARDLDIDLSTLETNKCFPESFPVVTVITSNEYFISTYHIYPEDFKKPSKILDFSWLENNIRKFWKEGVGTIWDS